MGQKKSRLIRFLSDHHLCCFCGGEALAETQDHLPPRSVFDNKKWPDGYVFPACTKCNSGSSQSDSIFALVSRIYPTTNESENVKSETEKLIRAYVETHPKTAKSLMLTANQKRNWAKKSKFELAKGESYGELPVIKMPDEWNQAIQIVSGKLIKALHYKHTGRIVPKNAEIKIKWWTNAEYMAGQFPSELLELAGEKVFLKSQNVDISSQFSYSYQTSADGNYAIYGVYFRFSFYVAGLVSFDPILPMAH